MMKLVVSFLALAMALVAAPALSAQSFAVHGRVYDASNDRGVVGLTVRLVPEARRESEHVASTSEDGSYRFDGVPEGRCVLEVRQGFKTVYSSELDVSGDTTKDVPLVAGEKQGTPEPERQGAGAP